MLRSTCVLCQRLHPKVSATLPRPSSWIIFQEEAGISCFSLLSCLCGLCYCLCFLFVTQHLVSHGVSQQGPFSSVPLVCPESCSGSGWLAGRTTSAVQVQSQWLWDRLQTCTKLNREPCKVIMRHDGSLHVKARGMWLWPLHEYTQTKIIIIIKKEDRKKLFDMMDMFMAYILVMVLQVYTYFQTHQVVYIKYVLLIVYQ